jgi:hypothetical protein
MYILHTAGLAMGDEDFSTNGVQGLHIFQPLQVLIELPSLKIMQ